MSEDDDIRGAFRQLKAEDAKVAGAFEVRDSALKPHWRWRHGVVGSSAAAVATAAILFLKPPAPEPGASIKTAATATQFEKYSELVSRELFAAEPAWQSPTEFLLDYEIALTEIEE